MRLHEARAAWAQDQALLASQGVHLPDVKTYTPDEWLRDASLAMDAAPQFVSTPNSGIPFWLTTSIDPRVFKVLFSPNKASEIFPEIIAGAWEDQTRLFPLVENGGEVSSFGDYNENGRATINADWPERQAYLFQTHTEYGDLDVARAARGLVNWVGELEVSTVTLIEKFRNLSYFFGVASLQNYGIVNDPALTATLTPGTKAAAHGNVWVYNGAIQATANEIALDVQSLTLQLIAQTQGLVDVDSKLLLVLSPQSGAALTSINIYGVSALDILKKTYKNMSIVTAIQYGVLSATNPQGIAAGNLVQLIAPEVENQQTGFVASNSKLRAHRMEVRSSSVRQKKSAGTWGAVIRQPFAIAQMLGV